MINNNNNRATTGIIISTAPGFRSQIEGNTIIQNSNSWEIFGQHFNFPTFHIRNGRRPTVRSSSRLLHAGADLNNPNIRVNARNLNIDTSNPNNFTPNRARFILDGDPVFFSDPGIFDNLSEYIRNRDFESVIKLAYKAIENYPESDYAIRAIPLLMMFYKRTDRCLFELSSYLENIKHNNLNWVVRENMPVLMMFAGEYFKAYSLYEELLASTRSNIDRLRIESQMAYSYLRLVETNARELPRRAQRTPRTFESYLEILDEINEMIFEYIDRMDPRDIPSEDDGIVIISAHPNPFNPITTISFTLPTTIQVTLNVYNIRGQRVKTLVNDTLNSGYHSVVWSGLNDSGHTVSSGIYFYRITAGEFTATRRIVMLK